MLRDARCAGGEKRNEAMTQRPLWGEKEHVVAALVGLGLAGALGDIEHDRRGRSRQLVGQVTAPARQRFDDSVGEHQEVERELVDVEPFVIEPFYARPPAAQYSE